MNRYWLCRAVESYLRNNVTYANQMFLIQKGLLDHACASLLNTNPARKENLQALFDLLGEVSKSTKKGEKLIILIAFLSVFS